MPDVGGLYGVVCCGESEIERGGVAYVRYFGVCGDVGQCLGNNMWRQRQLEPIGYGDTYIYIVGRLSAGWRVRAVSDDGEASRGSVRRIQGSRSLRGGARTALAVTEGVSQSPLVAVREYDRGNPP